jgi:hypothetical protein
MVDTGKGEPIEITGPGKVCLVWVDVKGKNKAEEESKYKRKQK